MMVGHQTLDVDSTQRRVLVRFTQDMAETLLRFFDAYQREEVVTIEVNDRGLWLVNPHNETRQFLGQADLTEQQRLRLERIRRRMM